MKYGNNDWQGEADEPDRTVASGAIPADIPEKVTPLEWTYQPDQRVDIGIDVTSFAGFDNKSVDPFGQAFEIYIDAPMLKNRCRPSCGKQTGRNQTESASHDSRAFCLYRGCQAGDGTAIWYG